MRVFNENKTTELKDYDERKGTLKPDRLLVRRHEAQDEVAERSHYEIKTEYPNGGKDVVKVIDVPFKPATEAYDEYEEILVYIPYSAVELAQREIAELKVRLRNSDYMAIKFAEGQLSAAEYAETKAERQGWRDKINALEMKL